MTNDLGDINNIKFELDVGSGDKIKSFQDKQDTILIWDTEKRKVIDVVDKLGPKWFPKWIRNLPASVIKLQGKIQDGEQAQHWISGTKAKNAYSVTLEKELKKFDMKFYERIHNHLNTIDGNNDEKIKKLVDFKVLLNTTIKTNVVASYNLYYTKPLDDSGNEDTVIDSMNKAIEKRIKCLLKDNYKMRNNNKGSQTGYEMNEATYNQYKAKNG
jgi:hypothetical protein